MVDPAKILLPPSAGSRCLPAVAPAAAVWVCGFHADAVAVDQRRQPLTTSPRSMPSKSDPLSACFAAVARLAGGIVEFMAPGRQAGFHVDRLVMRARRVHELLSEPSPNTTAARDQAGLLMGDVAMGLASQSFRVIWSENAQCSRVRRGAAGREYRGEADHRLVAAPSAIAGGPDGCACDGGVATRRH